MVLGSWPLIVLGIAALLSRLAGPRAEDQPADYLLGALIANMVWQVALGGTTFVIAARHGHVWSLLGFRRPRLKTPGWYGGILRLIPWSITLALLMSLVARVVVTMYVVIATALDYDFLLPEAQIPEEVFDNGHLQVLAGISIVFLAPVVEEVFFRGFIFAGLRRIIGLWPAAIISSLLFAVVHAQSGLVIPFTVVGLLLAYLYHRSKSIYVPVAMHFFFNAFSFLALVFLPELRVEE